MPEDRGLKGPLSMPTKPRVCRDCPGTGRRRPAPHPGPRCATHHRVARKGRSQARKDTHVQRTYGLTPEQYESLLEAQGGRCYVCRRKPGRKRLACDHWHGCTEGHSPDVGCPKCVRLLACSRCNRYMGWVHDDPEAFRRGAEGLLTWPAQGVLHGL